MAKGKHRDNENNMTETDEEILRVMKESLLCVFTDSVRPSRELSFKVKITDEEQRFIQIVRPYWLFTVKSLFSYEVGSCVLDYAFDLKETSKGYGLSVQENGHKFKVDSWGAYSDKEIRDGLFQSIALISRYRYFAVLTNLRYLYKTFSKGTDDNIGADDTVKNRLFYLLCAVYGVEFFDLFKSLHQSEVETLRKQYGLIFKREGSGGWDFTESMYEYIYRGDPDAQTELGLFRSYDNLVKKDVPLIRWIFGRNVDMPKYEMNMLPSSPDSDIVANDASGRKQVGIYENKGATDMIERERGYYNFLSMILEYDNYET